MAQITHKGFPWGGVLLLGLGVYLWYQHSRTSATVATPATSPTITPGLPATSMPTDSTASSFAPTTTPGVMTAPVSSGPSIATSNLTRTSPWITAAKAAVQVLQP